MNRPPKRTERGRVEPGDEGVRTDSGTADDAPRSPESVPGALARERPGAEGPVRIAPAEMPSQGDSAIPPGSIASAGRLDPRSSPLHRQADRPKGAFGSFDAP